MCFCVPCRLPQYDAAQHKTLRAHDERFIIGNNLTALSDIEDSLILYLCFQFSNSRCWVCTKTHKHTHKNHILPHKSTIKHPLSPETLKYLKIDPPQNNWDGTWSKETHTCSDESATGSRLRFSDVERKHLDGRGGD